MNIILKGTLMVALVAIMPATGASAQHRDARGRHAPAKVVKYREISVSRGHKFRKGQRIAVNQRRYVVNDWNRRGLRTPPRGYQWVRENNNSGDYLLVAAATGIIASILAQ
jgi:Ni/Co efflux regulator RcnB